jgi:TP901 family phage tail tape measure protein
VTAREVVVRLRAEIGNFVRDMRQGGEATTAAAAATRTSGQTMATAMTQTQAAAAATRAALLEAGKAAQETAKGFGLSYNSAGRLTDEFGNLVTEAHAAELGLETASEATQEFAAQTAHAAAAASAATAQSQTGMSALLANAHANEEAWGKVGKGMLAFGGAVVVGVGLAIAKFASFDQGMSSVDAATHETTANMELLREKAIEVGADTAFSANEAAQGIEELAKAGVSTKDILNGGLNGAMDLAAAGALGVGDAAEIAATAMVQFKLSGQDIPHVADLLAAGAGKAQGSVEDIGMALKQSGLVAAQFGLSVDDTVGSLAAFASAGLVGSDAGTSFKSMLLKLAAPAKGTQKLMDDLGISAYDAEGAFVGVTGLADQLKNNLGDLTQAQRDSALATIFGTDAIRGANVLYEQGGAGIQGWIDNVNDAGYAAETTARMQDNLAGDIEKLGGSFDTLMIKSGTGPSEMLRGITQAAESAVDAVGNMPTPILTAITIGAALIGGLALLGGAFITIVPKIAATKIAMASFNTGSAGMVTGLKKLGKAGGIAALGIAAVGIAMATMPNDRKKLNLDVMASDMIALGKSGSTVKDAFSPGMFDAINDAPMQGEKIETLGQALKKVTDITSNDQIWSGITGFTSGVKGMFGAGETTTQFKETQKAIQGMSDSLATMVDSGNAEEAGVAFAKIAEEGKNSGVSLESTAGAFTTYEAALRKKADTLKVTLKDEEYQQWMMGKVPPLIAAAEASAEGQTSAAQAQAEANEEVAKALAEVGLNADGTVASLGKLLDAMFATGLASMSANEATGAFHETLRALDVKIQEVIASQGIGNSIMNAAGTAFDATTASGYAAVGVFNDVATKGQNMSKAMAENGASQADLQGSLKATYDSLVTTARGFGASEAKARDMAREALGIPKDVKIETAIQNYADSLAKLHGVGAAADALNGKTANVWVTTHQNSIYSETHTSNGRGGSGGQTAGGWTGGVVGSLIGGLAGGGVVPGVAPLNSLGDNILATVNGRPFGLRSGEIVINEQATKANLPLLQAINDGTYKAPSKSLAGGYGASMSQSAYQPNSGAAIDYERLASVMSGGNSYSISVPKPGVGAGEIMAEIKFAERRNARGGARS